MRSAPHPPRGAVAGPDPGDEPFALLDFALGHALAGEGERGHLGEVLDRYVAASGGRAALLLQLPPWREPAVLAAFPASAADPVMVTAVSSLLTRHPAAGADGGCAEGPLALPRRLATAGGPDWAAPGPARLLAAYASPSRSPQAGGLLASAPRASGQPTAKDQAAAGPGPRLPGYALVLVTGSPSTRQLRSTARALLTVLAAQQARADDNAEIAERRAVSLALVDASPDAVVISDAARRIVSFNPAAERLTGHRAADAAGRDAAQLLIPERYRARYRSGRASWLASVGQGTDHGALPAREHLPVLRADGTERLAEVTSLPLEVRGEMYFCSFLRDVTELEQATAALAASEDRLRLLSALAPVGIAQTGPGGACTFVNERWCVLAGTAPGDFLGRSWLQVVHPDDARRVAAAWARATAGGVELRTDCRLAPPGAAAGDAGAVWVHATVAGLPERSGQPDGFLVALTNITARKRAEQDRDRLLAEQRAAVRSLTCQTERLNSLIAAAIPGVLLTDEHGMIVQLNESLCRLLGIREPPGELAGSSGERLLEPVARTFADPAQVTAEMSQRAARRERAGDLRFDCSDGRVLECDYWPVLAGGEYRGSLWLLWDVSARASAEQEREGRLSAELAARRTAEHAQQALSVRCDQLRELDEVKTRFLAQMSHELRAPLSSIVSCAVLFREEEAGLTAAGSRYLDMIERSAGWVLRMVGDLLLLSRIEAGVFPLDLAPVGVPGLAAEAVSRAAPDAAARGVTLELSPDGGGPELLADRHRLLQVLDNLIGNAVKFTDRGGQVRVGAEQSDGAWRIEVADSGIGIPPDELGRLFDRFYRASNAERAGRPGSGLGLAVVREIVELHGGRVEVASTPGRGTTVTAWLPLRPPGRPGHPLVT